MHLKSLQLRLFRNYRSLEINFKPGITVFTGKNGIGKTTVLESVSLLGSGRSFRNAKNSDFIHKKEELALLKGLVENIGLESEIEVKIYPQGKKVFVDKKLARTTKSLLQLLPTISFSPSDHQIVEGDSGHRKNFLNRAMANVDGDYIERLNAYNKALLQRNKVLKDNNHLSRSSSSLSDLLAPWEEQLLDHGSALIFLRNSYLQQLSPWATKEYGKISFSQDEFQLEYFPLGQKPNFPTDHPQDIRDNLSKLLKDSLRRDCILGSTQVGPHKDEILLTLNANKVKFYGSQGEKRTCALALRLGELALFREKMKKLPVLLFDDVSSELDSERRRCLVELLRKEDSQVLMTATELPSSLLGDVGKNFENLDLNSLGERT